MYHKTILCADVCISMRIRTHFACVIGQIPSHLGIYLGIGQKDAKTAEQRTEGVTFYGLFV